jgi:hypothetical protein
MSDWVEASKVDDLRDLFTTPPPYKGVEQPLETKTNSINEDKAARNAKQDQAIGQYMKLTGIAIVVAVIGYLIFSYAQSSETGSSYNEKVMTVAEIESADPTRFLTASGTWNENFWFTKLKVHGKVTSSATVATYKDVVIQVTYFSETETILSTESYVLYKFVPPHRTIEFEWTLNRPKACKRITWDVIGAEAAN